MKLHSLPKLKNYRRKAKIIGRGTSSGKGGHTVGRGMNGQSSRSGGMQTPRRDFEGGQNPLSKRLPKLKGFNRNYDPNKVVGISLGSLSKVKESEILNPESMRELGIVNKSITKLTAIKVLNARGYKGKHSFEGIQFSKTAKETVLKNGGSIK